MKVTVFIAIFLFFLFSSSSLFSQDKPSNRTELSGHWIRYDRRQDTILYVPYYSPIAEEVESVLRYSGIEFLPDNLYREHTWKMCGNDDRPDFVNGLWNLSEVNGNTFLNMMLGRQPVESFYLVKLTVDELVLVPVK